MIPDQDYIEELIDGLPIVNSTRVYKFDSLSLTDPNQRKLVFKYMTALYNWAMSLEQF